MSVWHQWSFPGAPSESAHGALCFLYDADTIPFNVFTHSRFTSPLASSTRALVGAILCSVDPLRSSYHLLCHIAPFYSYPRQIAADDEFVLMSVTLFKKHHDEFVQKARENK